MSVRCMYIEIVFLKSRYSYYYVRNDLRKARYVVILKNQIFIVLARCPFGCRGWAVPISAVCAEACM